MDSKVSYTVVGLFVVILASALIVAFFWLSQYRHNKTYHTYLVYMHAEVSGLSVQSSVRFNGVKVGYVGSIKLDKDNPQLVILSLKILQGTPITTSTVAILMPQGITGVVYVGLKAETTRAPLLKLRKGQKYPIIPARPSLFTQVSEVLPQITSTLKSLGESVNKVFDKENRTALRNILQHMNQFTKTLADNSKNLDVSMKSMKKILQNSEHASEQLPKVMQQLQATLISARNTSKQIDAAAVSLKYTLRDGRAAMSNFSNQLLPNTTRTMTKLNELISNLAKLSIELKYNPSVLVRGKQPALPGPGEK